MLRQTLTRVFKFLVLDIYSNGENNRMGGTLIANSTAEKLTEAEDALSMMSDKEWTI